MPTISSIKPQRNKKRLNIYLDGKFAFGLDLVNFIKLGLKVEQELTDEDIERIVKKAEFQKTLDKLLKFATLRPRSEKEIRDWFKRKKVHESLQKELFNRLKRLELVDDRKFAAWWVEQRLEFKFKSKREIEQELRNKGIKKEVISRILSDSKMDEEKIAKQLLEMKSYRWKNLDKYEARQKISGFLARKGFSWEVISRILSGK